MFASLFPGGSQSMQSANKLRSRPMRKPVILTVDDDPDVLHAIERDLKKRYEERYRVLRADSGRVALDLLRRVWETYDTGAMLRVEYPVGHRHCVGVVWSERRLYLRARA